MPTRIAHANILRARDHRARLTEPEGLLWWKLRELNRRGYHSRRQAPFRGYVLDFVEHGARVVVELDGGQHGLADRREHDAVRDDVLRSQGYHVLRFPNSEVFDDLERVVESILRVVDERRTPTRKIGATRQFSDLPTRGR